MTHFSEVDQPQIIKPRHTPGPWDLGNEGDACAEVQAGPVSICFDRADRYTGVDVISREEMLANVRLVMAAPDMLAALREILSEDYRHTVGRQMAIDAVRRATR